MYGMLMCLWRHKKDSYGLFYQAKGNNYYFIRFYEGKELSGSSKETLEDAVRHFNFLKRTKDYKLVFLRKVTL